MSEYQYAVQGRLIPEHCDIDEAGEHCDGIPEYMAEPLDGEVPCTLYACGDAEHVLHTITEVHDTTGYPAVVSPVVAAEAVIGL